MNKKQAKLKKDTTTAFLVVGCVMAVLLLGSGMINFAKFLAGADNFYTALKEICHSLVTAFSTFLFLRHIKFKRSIPLGIANLIVLIILACIYVIDNGGEIGITIARLTFAVIYAFFSSIHFFSNKIMRETFIVCVSFFVVYGFFFIDTTNLSAQSEPLYILIECLIIAYGVCEFVALNHSSGWYCENCGSKNHDKNLFCKKCGAKNPFIND